MDKCSYINGLCDAGSTLFNFIKKEGFDVIYDKTPKLVKDFIQGYAKSSVINLVDELSVVFNQPDFIDELKLNLSVNCSLADYIVDLYKNKTGNEVINSGLNLIKSLSNCYPVSEVNCDSYNNGVKIVFDKLKEFPKIINVILSGKINSLKGSLRTLKKLGLSSEISH